MALSDPEIAFKLARGVSRFLENLGYGTVTEFSLATGRRADVFGVNERGELNPDDLRQALRRDTGVVSIMMANNETGVLFPINEVGQIVREHSDAVIDLADAVRQKMTKHATSIKGWYWQ